MSELVGQMFQQLRGLCSVVQDLAAQVKSLSSAAVPQSIVPPAGVPPAQSFASVVQSGSAGTPPPPQEYRTLVREELRELEEQRKRKCSLVIRGLGASSAEAAVERFVIVSEHLIGESILLSDVVRIPSETDLFRGKVADDGRGKHILDRSKELKNSPCFPQVFIRRDLTYKQRQEIKSRRATVRGAPGL